MKLLIVVLNNPDLVSEVVPVLVELDVRKIVSLETETVMNFLAREVPIFAGIRELVTSPRAYTKTLFGITDSGNILEELDNFLKDINIDLKESGDGYALTIPIDGLLEGETDQP